MKWYKDLHPDRNETPDFSRKSQKKFFLTAGSLFLAAYLGIGALSCKSPQEPEPEPEPEVYYDITAYTRNVFTNKNLSTGDVILNGEKKADGSTFSVKNGVINTLDVDKVPGFIEGYIAGIDPSKTKYILRDKNGHNQVTIAKNTDLYLLLIPDDFNTQRLAKSVGQSVPTSNNESMGNGIIQNYDKKDIPTGVYELGAEPTPDTYNIIRIVRKEINELMHNPDYGRILYLEEFKDVTGYVSDGFTAEVDTLGGGHAETVSGNVIIRSQALISIYANTKGWFKAEAFQAVTGIRQDAGEPGTPYVSPQGPDYAFQNDAQRAAWLCNLYPPGFHLDPDSTPANTQAAVYETTNRDPNMIYPGDPDYPRQPEPGIMDNFMNFGMPSQKYNTRRGPIPRTRPEKSPDKRIQEKKK